LANLRIDGTAMSLLGSQYGGTRAAGGDLLSLGYGSGSTAVAINRVLCRNLSLINPPTGHAALHLMGIPGNGPADVDCEGSIASAAATFSGPSPMVLDYGRGIQADSCTQCSFRMASNTTQDYNLSVSAYGAAGTSPCPSSSGTTASIGSPGLIYDALGAESVLTSCVDSFSLGAVSFPDRVLLANGALANTSPSPPIEQVVSSTGSSSSGTVLQFSATAVHAFVPNVAVPLWTLLRRGSPTTSFTDTWDTASHITSAIDANPGASFLSAGQIYRLRVCNETGFTETIVGTTNVSTAGGSTVAAGSCANFALEITNVSTPAVLIFGD
jgi:hypothetical protein